MISRLCERDSYDAVFVDARADSMKQLRPQSRALVQISCFLPLIPHKPGKGIDFS